MEDMEVTDVEKKMCDKLASVQEFVWVKIVKVPF